MDLTNFFDALITQIGGDVKLEGTATLGETVLGKTLSQRFAYVVDLGYSDGHVLLRELRITPVVG